MRTRSQNVTHDPRTNAGSYDVVFTRPWGAAAGVQTKTFDLAQAYEVIDGGTDPWGTSILMDSAQGGGFNLPEGLQSRPCEVGRVVLGPFRKLTVTFAQSGALDDTSIVIRIYTTRSLAVHVGDPAGKSRVQRLLELDDAGLNMLAGASPQHLTFNQILTDEQREGLDSLGYRNTVDGKSEVFDVARFWGGWLAADVPFAVYVYAKPSYEALTTNYQLIQHFHSETNWGFEPTYGGSAAGHDDNRIDFDNGTAGFVPFTKGTTSGTIGSPVNVRTGVSRISIPAGSVRVVVDWATAGAINLRGILLARGA